MSPNEHSTPLIAAGKADLMISPREFLSQDHPTQVLFEEQHVVAGWSGNVLLSASPAAMRGR
jgi:LysR family nod box-dependent transcriptional activator